METEIRAVHQYTRELIESKPELIQQIKELTMDPANRKSGKYLCTGLKINDIYLGLDFIPEHIKKFSRILVNNMLVETYSHGQADLSRVLLKVVVDGVHVANLTEDVSENGTFKIFDEGISFGPYFDYLKHFFKDDVGKAVFVVYPDTTRSLRDRLIKPPFMPIRLPIIDLDHVELNDRFYDLYEKFDGQRFNAILKEYTLEIAT